MSNYTPVVRVDRHGRDVRLDTWGMEYVRDEDGFAFYVTPCCDASAKGTEWGIVCRSCYEDVDPSLGGVPEPYDVDMTDGERARLIEWKAFERAIVRRSLGLPAEEDQS